MKGVDIKLDRLHAVFMLDDVSELNKIAYWHCVELLGKCMIAFS